MMENEHCLAIGCIVGSLDNRAVFLTFLWKNLIVQLMVNYWSRSWWGVLLSARNFDLYTYVYQQLMKMHILKHTID